ncbi:harmonin-binding protein USHBP1 [Discoglossus pictus]
MEGASTSEEGSEKPSLANCGDRGSQYDLFLQLQGVISSLESCVWSWRSPPSSVAGDCNATTQEEPTNCHAKMASLAIQELKQELTPSLPVNDPRWFQSEIVRYQEQNAALRVKLKVTDRELTRSKAMLGEFIEERDRLQSTVKDLQGNLMDNDPYPNSNPMCADLGDLTSEPSMTPSDPLSWQAPLSTLQSLIQYLQSLPAIQTSKPDAPDAKSSSMETEIERLRGHLDHMKRLNDRLCVTLEECKTDSEKLSMKLGKLESTCTAVRLALQSSERCLKTYSVLLALVEAKEEILLGPLVAGDFLKSGWSLLPKDLEIKTKLFMREVKKTFRREELSLKDEERGLQPNVISSLYSPWLSAEEEQTLKDYIRSLKWDLASVTLIGDAPTGQTCSSLSKEVAHLADIIKTKVDDVIKSSMEAFPGQSQKPQRTQILQELMQAREGLSELKAKLQLLQTENRALELQTMSQSDHERAYQLIIGQLQVELSKWSGTWREEDSGSIQELLSQENQIQGPPVVTPDIQSLLSSLKRSSEMRVHVEGITLELDKLSCHVRTQRVQSAQIITDFFKAHRKLFLTYQSALKKYQEQQSKLESQANMMTQHQRQQLHNLMQNVLSLQGQQAVRDTLGETSL